MIILHYAAFDKNNNTAKLYKQIGGGSKNYNNEKKGNHINVRSIIDSIEHNIDELLRTAKNTKIQKIAKGMKLRIKHIKEQTPY